MTEDEKLLLAAFEKMSKVQTLEDLLAAVRETGAVLHKAAIQEFKERGNG